MTLCVSLRVTRKRNNARRFSGMHQVAFWNSRSMLKDVPMPRRVMGLVVAREERRLMPVNLKLHLAEHTLHRVTYLWSSPVVIASCLACRLQISRERQPREIHCTSYKAPHNGIVPNHACRLKGIFGVVSRGPCRQWMTESAFSVQPAPIPFYTHFYHKDVR